MALSDAALARVARILKESGAFYIGPVRSSPSGLIHVNSAELREAAERMESIRTWLFISAASKTTGAGRGRPKNVTMKQLFANLEGFWEKHADDMAGVSFKAGRTQGPFVRFCVAFCREMAEDLDKIDHPQSAELAEALRDVVNHPVRVKSWHHKLGIKRRLTTILGKF